MSHGFTLDIVDDNLRTPILVAAANKHPSFVKMACHSLPMDHENPPEIATMVDDRGWGLFHYAAAVDDPETIRLAHDILLVRAYRR